MDRYTDQVMAHSGFQNAATFREQKHALSAILSCRTAVCGEIKIYCPECKQYSWFYHSCGHRSCPKCQNHETTRWLDRQRSKLLPTDYFLVTFTLPAELRQLARRHPKNIYNLLFRSSSEALGQATFNPRFFGGLIGFTGVLHTHSRKLDFHPHVHFVVPGIAYLPEKRLCIHSRNRFLIPERVLNRLFRGKFLSGLRQLGLRFNPSVCRKDWVVDCRFSGKGDSALKYLARYLYRGVISESNIVSHQDGQVTFGYLNSETNRREKRTLPGDRFTRLVLQHVLPKGFRRVRDYGFLHGNAKRTLTRLQLLLVPKITDRPARRRPAFRCRCCGKPAMIVAVAVRRPSVDLRTRSPPVIRLGYSH